MDAGDVTLVMDRTNAPCAINSFESLVEQGYFDDTSCHRLAPGFVLQCGDPTATSRGGPGYSYADELTGKETYLYGTLAMANAGPNTNGSQFFIVIADDAGLPPSYTVLGSVDTDGMQVVEAIAAQGGVDPSNPQGSAPKEGGHIKSVDEVSG
jgi:peptidyl-prolyl cis-trans isomerase B (cyclophilin B)